MTSVYESLVPTPPGWRLDWQAIHDAFDWVRRMQDCPQDPVYHAEGDVWIHTRMVMETLAALEEWRGLGSRDRRIVFWGALMHDVGKPDCTRTGDDGRITSRGHSRRGEILARVLLWRLGVPFNERECICALVAHHQSPFFLVDRDDAERQSFRISLRVRCDHLALVTEADAKGRVCEDMPRLLDNIELFREFCRERGCYAEPKGFPSDHTRFLYFRDPSRLADYEAHDDTSCDAVLMSGLPASGKDHWIADHLPGHKVVSLDGIRREMGVSPVEGQGKVVAAARERARQCLRVGSPFVWNATNLSRQMRSRSLDLFANYKARIRIVYLECAEPELVRRNQKRQRPVPTGAIERMLQRWEVPELTEAHQVDWVTT